MVVYIYSLNDPSGKIRYIGKTSNSLNKEIYQYDINLNLVNKYKSTKEAAKIIKGSENCICKCCYGRLKTYKGFIWSNILLVNQKGDPLLNGKL